MKFNYRDKIIAGILLAIVILLVGFFVPVKNMNKQNKADKKTLAEKQTIKADYEAKIAQIPKLQESIRGLYSDAKEATKIFVPIDDVDNERKLDKYMQKYADDCKIKVSSLELQSSKVAPIDYYYLLKGDDLGSLRSEADINGTLQKEYAASIAGDVALSQRAKESVIMTQYAFKVNGTKKNIWKYLEAIKNIDEAVVINSVSLADYSFGVNAARKAGVNLPDSPEDGSEVSVSVGEKGEIKNTSDAQIVLTLYSVIEMEEPNVD